MEIGYQLVHHILQVYMEDMLIRKQIGKKTSWNIVTYHLTMLISLTNISFWFRRNSKML